MTSPTGEAVGVLSELRTELADAHREGLDLGTIGVAVGARRRPMVVECARVKDSLASLGAFASLTRAPLSTTTGENAAGGDSER